MEGGGGCAVVLRPVHDIMVIWELFVLKWSLEPPQSLHSYISLQENERVRGMKFWGAELLECKGQKGAGLFEQVGSSGRAGERDWWVTSECAVLNPRETQAWPQRDVNQPFPPRLWPAVPFFAFQDFLCLARWQRTARACPDITPLSAGLCCSALVWVTSCRDWWQPQWGLAGLWGGGRRFCLLRSLWGVRQSESCLWFSSAVRHFVLWLWWFSFSLPSAPTQTRAGSKAHQREICRGKWVIAFVFEVLKTMSLQGGLLQHSPARSLSIFWLPLCLKSCGCFAKIKTESVATVHDCWCFTQKKYADSPFFQG